MPLGILIRIREKWLAESARAKLQRLRPHRQVVAEYASYHPAPHYPALPVDPEMVHLEGGAIKETGLYAVKLALGYDIEAEVKVAVIKAQDRK